MLSFRNIESGDELAVAFHVLVDLRPHLTHESFYHLYKQAHERDGYTFLGAFDGAACVGLMGYRILYDFVHGKHLYVDDLVVVPSCRSRGIGKRFLEIAETLAREYQCTGLRLCTGAQNTEAIRFYEREGWQARSLAFKKKPPHLPAEN